MTLTRTEMAYEKIREDILNGALRPDSPLRLDMLRGRHGLSYSPLREALVKLEGEGLVVLHEQRGFRVSPLHNRDIWDIINTRILIETFALRDAIKRGVDQVLILKCLDKLRIADFRFQSSEKADRILLAGQLRDAHTDFHMALIEATSSRRLYRVTRQLISETERYRAPFLSLLLHELKGRSLWMGRHDRDINVEHTDIVEAVLRGDADRATRLLRGHYRQTAEMIASQVAPIANDKA